MYNTAAGDGTSGSEGRETRDTERMKMWREEKSRRVHVSKIKGKINVNGKRIRKKGQSSAEYREAKKEVNAKIRSSQQGGNTGGFQHGQRQTDSVNTTLSSLPLVCLCPVVSVPSHLKT